MIEFANDKDRQDFLVKLHPLVKAFVSKLAVKFADMPFKLSEVGRTDDDSERIYMVIAARLLNADINDLSDLDKKQRLQIEGMSDAKLKEWARFRASWHKPFCAVDISLKGWDPQIIQTAVKVLKIECPAPMWEVITQSHGTGPHFHIARRDFAWLKNFPGGLKSFVDQQPKSDPNA